MTRFYAMPQDINKDSLYIRDKAEIHHIKDVLRLKEKDALSIFSDNGFEYSGAILKINPEYIYVQIKSAIKKNAGGVRIALACAIPKKAKIDYIIEKLVELGIDEFIPLKTERTIVHLKDREDARLIRWKKIALAAVKQCGRKDMPQISRLLSFSCALDYARKFDLALIPTLYGDKKQLKEIIKDKKFNSIIIFIGPEGDFSEAEVELAIKNNCIPVSLGENTLKVDTAAIAIISFLKLY